MKLNIQKIFTKIRNLLNNREDELLLDVEKKFDNSFFKEELIKKCENLPNKVKICLSKAKKFKENGDDFKLNLLINNIIEIENNIKDLNVLNETIKKSKSNENKIKFYINNEGDIFEKIKILGDILHYKFKFKICPKNIKNSRLYTLTGENNNIMTKIGQDDQYAGTICVNELNKCEENKWKINILNSKENKINIGVAPIDFNIDSSDYSYDWYLYLRDLTLWSGPPHNYDGVKTKFSKIKNGEIIVIMNMTKGTLKFIIDGEDKGESYINIPMDKPLSPYVILKKY